MMSDAVIGRPGAKIGSETRGWGYQLKSLAPRAAELARRLPPHADGEVLVKLKPAVEVDSYMSHRLMEGVQVMEQFRIPERMKDAFGGELVRLKLPEGVSTAEGIALLEDDEQIAYVTSNDKRRVSTWPDDEMTSEMWGLESIDAAEAWKHTTGSRNGPVIAVLDTGIDAEHPDLAPNLWTNPGEIPGNGIDDDGNGVVDDVHGYDAYHDDGTPEDAHGHGTHCAGIIGATGNNGRGVTGVNWQTRIMPIKIFDNSSDKPKSSLSAMLRGVAYAGNNGARLTSNSWGGPTRRQSLERAFSSSRAFHVMGAGNDGQDNDEKPFYPASYRTANSVSVASVTSSGGLSSFSNFGSSSVDLAAPGSSIYSTLPGGRYGSRSGTSMATPHVTGVAGLLLSMAPGLSNGQLRSLLLRGVVPKASLQEKTVTGGVVNADRSLELLIRG